MIASNLSDNSSLIETLLTEQQRTTAVEKFAQIHNRGTLPLQEKHYRDLIPLTAPRPGEQYAFEVDLDACSGCKSCVVACHNLNGLEDDETWRGVGMLYGGTVNEPLTQHVTTACHHCVEPACLEGCPVEAYEKDPQTGIVHHLDDQCIGCQYCILKCPYDVPKYSREKGIVRKCDMCHDRLNTGEAPACVQSCPNQAIRIAVVNKEIVVEESEANVFLPGAPEPGYTIPTTTYKTKRVFPRNMLPADYYSVTPQHSHLPLVFMLVLTQMSVGAFVVEQWLSLFASSDVTASVRPIHLSAALLLGFLGLGSSVFHLGRPLYAYRAWIGLRRSWLSREILAFGLFGLMASVYVGTVCLQYLGLAESGSLGTITGLVTAGAGVAGVFCSIMIYVDTRRAFWNATFTSLKFIGTMIVLGTPTALLISLAAASLSSQIGVRHIMEEFGTSLCVLLIVASAFKLSFESLIFTYLSQNQNTPLKRTATLMTGELALTTMKRYFFGIIGGVVAPGILISERSLAGGSEFSPAFIAVVVSLSLVVLFIGELLERYLFFTAVVAPKMPGAAAT